MSLILHSARSTDAGADQWLGDGSVLTGDGTKQRPPPAGSHQPARAHTLYTPGTASSVPGLGFDLIQSNCSCLQGDTLEQYYSISSKYTFLKHSVVFVPCIIYEGRAGGPTSGLRYVPYFRVGHSTGRRTSRMRCDWDNCR